MVQGDSQKKKKFENIPFIILLIAKIGYIDLWIWLPPQLHNKIETLTRRFIVSNETTKPWVGAILLSQRDPQCLQPRCSQHMHTQFNWSIRKFKSEIYLEPFLALINLVLKLNPFHQISYYNNTHGVEWFPLKECFLGFRVFPLKDPQSESFHVSSCGKGLSHLLTSRFEPKTLLKGTKGCTMEPLPTIF
jgi:hypothetical protein